MARKKANSFESSAYINRITLDFWMRRLQELAINSIEWLNLPPEIDARYLELILYGKGMAVFYRDDVVNLYVALQTEIGDRLNIYDIPNWRRAYSNNGYGYNLTGDNSVIIFNNYIHTPTIIDMEIYAYKLYELDRAIDVNVKGQKTPRIIKCGENQRLVLENLFMKYDGNIPFIYGDKQMDFSQLEGIDIVTPYVADKLQIVKRQIFNEALTFLGIENNSNEKAERMVTNESLSNMGAIEAQRNNRLNARKQACEQINRMFGLNVNVKFRNPLSSEVIREEMLTGVDTEAEVTENE